MKAYRESRGTATLYNLGARCEWVVNAKLRPLYPLAGPGTHSKTLIALHQKQEKIRLSAVKRKPVSVHTIKAYTKEQNNNSTHS